MMIDREFIAAADPKLLFSAMIGTIGVRKAQKVIEYYVEMQEAIDKEEIRREPSEEDEKYLHVMMEHMKRLMALEKMVDAQNDNNKLRFAQIFELMREED